MALQRQNRSGTLKQRCNFYSRVLIYNYKSPCRWRPERMRRGSAPEPKCRVWLIVQRNRHPRCLASEAREGRGEQDNCLQTAGTLQDLMERGSAARAIDILTLGFIAACLLPGSYQTRWRLRCSRSRECANLNDRPVFRSSGQHRVVGLRKDAGERHRNVRRDQRPLHEFMDTGACQRGGIVAGR
jgi:hypothetical protein